jgi:hypothetical protein
MPSAWLEAKRQERKELITAIFDYMERPMWLKFEKEFASTVFAISLNSNDLNKKKE